MTVVLQGVKLISRNSVPLRAKALHVVTVLQF